MNPERRQTPRVSERLSLSVGDDDAAIHTETMNLSAAGVYCVLERCIAPMTKLQLELELPGRPKITRVRCCGVVVRAEAFMPHPEVVPPPAQPRFQTAILFTELAPRDRQAISAFVRDRLASSSPPPASP